MREPLPAGHVKPRLPGHWGTTPGLNLLYAHMTRVISERDRSTLYVTGPGHGGPGLAANARRGRDEDGLRGLFRQFSSPGGIPGHVAPETPGPSSKAASSATPSCTPRAPRSTTPDLLVMCVVGDGEAETGLVAAS